MSEFVIRRVDDGTFLEAYDPDWQPDEELRQRLGAPEHQTGLAHWVEDLDQALAFPSFADAWAKWREQSTVVPLRPDGKPNRPLTAHTVEVLSIEQAREDQRAWRLADEAERGYDLDQLRRRDMTNE